MTPALDGIDPGGWAPYLEPGERLLWEGRPATGLRLPRGALAAIPFGLAFAGVAVVWMGAVLFSGGPWVAALFGLPFVAVGLYLAVGRVFWDAYERRHTAYALTDRRAIVARSAWGRSLRSWPIAPDAETELRPGPEATVVFARDRILRRRPRHGLPLERSVEHAFRLIPDGERVHALLRAVQRARQEGR